MGLLLSLGYLKITELAQMFGLFFHLSYRLSINFGKIELGYILGVFSTNSPGHPVSIASAY
jgi:hypothetical protein